MDLKVIANNQVLHRVDRNIIMEDSIYPLYCNFTLPIDYTRINTAYFMKIANMVESYTPVNLDESNTCIVPNDYIKYPGFMISLGCSNDDNYIPIPGITIRVMSKGI